MKRRENTNRYKLVQRSDLTIASEAGGKELKRLFDLGEQVRAAFVGLAGNLYDRIEIEPDPYWDDRARFKVSNPSFILLKDGWAFDFLGSCTFSYRPQDAEPWDLEINGPNDDFGSGMSVSAKTPRECVRAMITERKKDLRRQLASLNRFRDFEDYTHNRHVCC